MSKLLKDCLSSRYTIVALVGVCLLAVGLLTWGLAPQLVIGALPVLGIIACLLPCLLPIYWLRRTSSTAANGTPPEQRQVEAPPGLPEKS